MNMRVAPENGTSPASPPPAPRRGLQASYHRGAHRNHPAAGGARRMDGIAGRFGNFQILLMHFVSVDVIDPHRLECPRAHMQRDEGMTDVARIERGENISVEM